MSHPGRVLALLALLAAAGCVKLDSYSCAQSSECQDGGVPGTCEQDGLCSFPDVECPSGKKYGELAGQQSGQCVGMVGDGTTTAPTTGPGPTDTGATTFDPTTTTTFDPTTTFTSEVTITTTTSTDPTLTGDPSTTTGEPPTCGDIGDRCVDGACCGGCAVCDEHELCIPAPADQGQDLCGVCSFCGGDGECTPAAIDTPCPVDCDDIVWKEVVVMAVTACYSYGPMETTGTCDGEGACTLPDPVAARCPEPMLIDTPKLAECELICHEEMHPCVPGGPASAVTMDAYCYLASQTPGCTTTCSDDNSFLNPATCDEGFCVHPGQEECGSYVCDPEALMCLTGCVTDEHCAMNTTCQNGECL